MSTTTQMMTSILLSTDKLNDADMVIEDKLYGDLKVRDTVNSMTLHSNHTDEDNTRPGYEDGIRHPDDPKRWGNNKAHRSKTKRKTKAAQAKASKKRNRK